MLDSSCNTFLDELSSKSPVPGGGGASAYVGALGMAIGMMVGNLTIGKKKYKEVEDEIIEFQKQSEVLLEKFKALVDEDAVAFFPLSQAYGIRAITEEEVRKKDEIMQKVLIEATRVPLEIAGCCCEAIELLKSYAKKGSAIAISDVGVGAVFLMAALQGAKLNVLINTKILKDQEEKQRFEQQIQELVDLGEEAAQSIYSEVEAALR